ncbi:MAG TPA: carboxypeptidase regulatory-like domain-containing protein [Vicinamibacterales bacterium]
MAQARLATAALALPFALAILSVPVFARPLTGPALAQPAATATLRVTVVDPSGAVVPRATVTVTGAEEATKGAAVTPVRTTDVGLATITGLKPGRYSIQAEFPGFETRTLPDVRIRPGDNKQVAVLELAKVETSVTVGQDKQSAAADPRGTSFGTTLTREQIEALSDDPVIFQQQLNDMAGPGAVIRVDGFEGSPLPAKAQIRSIRISRDQFAAEFHSAGGVAIEIITQPGLGPLRYNANTSGRNGDFSARSPFVATKGPEENMRYGFGVGGGLIKNKSSFNLNVFGSNAYDTPNLNAALPDGTDAQALNLRAKHDILFVNGQMDYALTLDQTLRFGYNLTRFSNDNLGVGGFDEADRAYSNENTAHNIRVQHYGPIGRRMFSRSRLQLFISDTNAQSATNAPTVRVNDAFTSGGAQVAGGDHSRRLNLGSDLDYVRGRHSVRSGIVFDAAWTRSDSTANYLGTYTFDNLVAYLAGQPSNYTRRIGNPLLSYRLFDAALYSQDDIRLRKNLTLSAGLRYEVQSHVADTHNVGPRIGVTWAPFKNGQTTLRGSAGLFYDWMPGSTFEQTLRVDGQRQQEVNILNPTYPDPGIGGVIPPTNRYVLDPAYHMPQTQRVSAGVDQTLAKVIRVSATYSHQRGVDLARGLNLNAPVNGVRPDPAYRTVVDVVSDAASWQNQLQIDATVNPGALLPAFKGPRINWKRTTVFLNYSLAKADNNTDGPFSVPATGDLSLERGPASDDIRHRLNLSVNNQIVRNLMVSMNLNAQSATPYTLLTGRDDNGDGIFNDRPAGVGRNTLRAQPQATVNTFLGYQFAFGRTAPLPPGIGVFGGGNSAQVRTFDQGAARYRLLFYVQAQNLTNRANFIGYSGTILSPFYLKPTAVRDMRKIDVGFNLQF